MHTIATIFEVNTAAAESAIAISLGGIMPVYAQKDFGFAAAPLYSGKCLTVKTGVAKWSFVAGCEYILNNLLLTVSAAAKNAVKAVRRKYQAYCRRVKTAVALHAPRFLRL